MWTTKLYLFGTGISSTTAITYLQKYRCFLSLTVRGCLLGLRHHSQRRFFLNAALLYNEKHLSLQKPFFCPDFLFWREYSFPKVLFRSSFVLSGSVSSETCILMLHGPDLWHQLHFVFSSSSIELSQSCPSWNLSAGLLMFSSSFSRFCDFWRLRWWYPAIVLDDPTCNKAGSTLRSK